MVEPRYRWQFADAVTPTPAAARAAADRGLTMRMAGILAARGVTTADEITAWFGEPADGLHDPAGLPDADRALARLRTARAMRSARANRPSGSRNLRNSAGFDARPLSIIAARA